MIHWQVTINEVTNYTVILFICGNEIKESRQVSSGYLPRLHGRSDDLLAAAAELQVWRIFFWRGRTAEWAAAWLASMMGRVRG